MTRLRLRLHTFVLWLTGGVLLLFLATPLIALFARTSVADMTSGLRHPLVWSALRLSAFTSATSLLLVVVLGTPLAWGLAQTGARSARVMETLIQLPMVIPPAVAGIALLLAFGQRGLVSAWLYPSGGSVAFTTTAVVMAEVFVSAPFFIQAAMSAFRRVDPHLVIVARSLGAPPLTVLRRVALPLAAPGLVAAAATSWARALGEFGATLMFAGNLQGKTQTLPLAVYTALESDLRAAQALSVILVMAACGLLLVVRHWLQPAAGEQL